ncbi:transposase [Roseiflexus sp. RS-1]|uniref:transposase n=1 Tax=Roseiflexus sp. (strain RS-1) TaxID=357808 RepID=UPI0012ED6817|nr:transposase [Roseiflexus sp. RS-1]
MSSGEGRQLFWNVVLAVAQPCAHILHWSWQRRCHHALAQAAHCRRRARQLPPVVVAAADGLNLPAPAVIALPNGEPPAVEGANPPGEATREEIIAQVWARVAPLLPVPRRAGRQIVHDRRQILEAMVHVMHTDCGWSALPSHFPPGKTVHDHSVTWRKTGIWAQIWVGLRLPGARPFEQLQL